MRTFRVPAIWVVSFFETLKDLGVFKMAAKSTAPKKDLMLRLPEIRTLFRKISVINSGWDYPQPLFFYVINLFRTLNCQIFVAVWLHQNVVLNSNSYASKLFLYRHVICWNINPRLDRKMSYQAPLPLAPVDLHLACVVYI